MKLSALIAGGAIATLFIVGGIMFGLPLYGMWTAEQSGRAALAKAESTRQAQVIDAKAKLEAAQYLGQAADEIQSKLTPEYLAYLRIQMMGEVGEHNDRAIYFDAPSVLLAPSAPAQ